MCKVNLINYYNSQVVYETKNYNELAKEEYSDFNKITKSFSIIEKDQLNKNHGKTQIACAEFDKREGWHILNLKTFQPFSNEIQSFFAGYLEGFIYHELISFHYTNIFKSLFDNKELPDDLKTFMKQQEEFIRNLAEEKSGKIQAKLI